SSPKISESTVNLPDSGSVTNPIAIPETGFVICTPASIRANVPAQTVAIEDEPLDSRISETIRIVYGFSAGIILESARCARFPCPTSLLDVPLKGLASPVENGGKL